MIQTQDKSLCCGCSACQQVCARQAITMERDGEGFDYPVIDPDKCVDCGACERVCPIENGSAMQMASREVLAAVSRDEAITRTSSSGGVFRVVAEGIISRGGVVYGAIYNDCNQVIHARAESIEELEAMQGSKYVQSSLEGIFTQISKDLREARTVLFCGTPCQVAAVRLACEKTGGQLFTIDFVCHGVPSPGMFEDYKNFAAKYTHRPVKGITMRDKRDLRGFFHSTLHLEGKDLYDKQIANLWLKMYFSELITRPSCHACAFASPTRVSDITLGDFWGGKETHKNLFALDRGVSMCLINTPAGEAILPREKLIIEQSDIATPAQPCLHSPAAPSPRRAEFWQEYDPAHFERIARRWWSFGKWNIIKRRLKNLL